MNERAGFKDHFSAHASAYADARPRYPEALYDWLAAQCPARALACDVGCGNGQASVALAERFEAVIASDPSAAQIANAVRHPRVAYRVEAAEALSVAPASVDLLTVAQALHWFDFEPFFARAREVLKPDGVFAAWSYGVMRIAPAIDAVLGRFEHQRVGKYWPPERCHVDAAYATIAFPFERMPTPAFAMTQSWTASDALAYLETWSAVQRHDRATGTRAIDALRPEFEAAWGDPSMLRTVEWPLLVWVGRQADEAH
jgi:SAM-dependent methyltransferase